jgi:hypothetical protein
MFPTGCEAEFARSALRQHLRNNPKKNLRSFSLLLAIPVQMLSCTYDFFAHARMLAKRHRNPLALFLPNVVVVSPLDVPPVIEVQSLGVLH